ncbi:hypothetical protein DXX93_12720 [Thalassotalea euphylliae]|uniref:Porin n=1 Tax=Thalassotalea euphylliae TaxID=1655234 RepID=A0A3E0TRT0_9GAMM|nr:TorF family putative porin [Thalassotalea euphylliae]REL27341.1 hypothetical protein DXX93_12720 [Thalassotalea euphylliae]
MKSKLLSVILAGTIFSAHANAELSTNIGVTSNYIFRGVTQSANDAAISGGINYNHTSGFYAGIWLSSIDFGSDGQQKNGTETDYFLGYTNTIGAVSYDIGYALFAYPTTGFEDSNFGEAYFNGSYADFNFGLAYTVYSQVEKGQPFDSGDLYYSIGYNLSLPEEFNLGLTYGYYTFDADSDLDYGHFQADISKGEFTLTISKADEEAGDDDTIFAVSWVKTF